MQGQMDAKAAVKIAKECVVDTFDDENANSPRLEEIRIDGTTWKVTISFLRAGTSLAHVLGGRVFKVVEINDHTGQVRAVTHRNLNASAPD